MQIKKTKVKKKIKRKIKKKVEIKKKIKKKKKKKAKKEAKKLNMNYLFNIQNLLQIIKYNLHIIGELIQEYMEKIQDIAEYVETLMDWSGNMVLICAENVLEKDMS